METESALLTPLVTPFDGAVPDESDVGDRDVDEDALANLVTTVLDAGLDGVVPCGTTGEFAALSETEYETVVETTVDAAGDATVIAGPGGTAVGEVRERLRLAANVGADAALVVAPYYQAAPKPEGNERFFEAALADAPLPVYLYNIPETVGQTIDVDTVVSLVERGLVAGIKESSGDQRYLGELLRRAGEDLTVYQGFDGAFVPSLALGADGGVNALAQVVPDAFADAARAIEAGDLATARSVQLERIAPLFEACRDHGVAAVVKTILANRGTIPSAVVRPPLVELSDEAHADVLGTIEDVTSPT